MAGDNIRRILDREPVWRKVEDQISNPGHRIRNSVGNIGDSVPEFQHRNLGGGIATGTLGAAIGVVLEDTIGIPFGGSSDIIETQRGEGANEYVVNVNAPTENIAQARAFIDSGTGFTSILTDKLDVQDVELIGTRTIRDTYQIKLRIED